jgi:DNA-binding Xre family transcriptional regulator
MSQNRYPRLPIEALRSKFWEVSGEKFNPDYATPFHKMRVLEQLADWEMAEKMGMNVDDYNAMEQGRAKPVATDILMFCEVVDCHPLDLYVEPGGGVPLPQEIFESLLIILDGQGYDVPFLVRTRDRLDVEIRNANIMLENNVNEISPLLIAMGYAPDMKKFNAPLYRPRDEAQKKLIEGQGGLFSETLIDKGSEQPRVYMENCLNAYELELEQSSRIHMQLAAEMVNKSIRTKDTMRNLAVYLYGQEGADIAMGRLGAFLASTPDRDALRDQFLQNPGLLWDLTPQNHRAMQYKGSVEAQTVRTKANLLFRAAILDERNRSKFEGGDVAHHSKTAFHEWNHFKLWRSSPRTQRLLDWFENWLVLAGRLKNQDPSEVRAWRGPGTGFPFLPK